MAEGVIVEREEREAPAAPLVGQGEAEARREALTLLTSIFCIAGCGLIYELLIATVASYQLGSSVTQFSISIGVFIGAMGVGSHLSQRVTRRLLGTFILVELALGILGGASVCLLFATYPHGAVYWVTLYGLLFTIGALTGLELPLLTRILNRYGTLRTIIAQALSFDYLGALAGSLLLPLLLLPSLGMARTAFLVGLVNVGVAVWNVRVFRDRLRVPGALLALGGLCGGLLGAGFAFSLQLVSLMESRLYEDQVIYTAQTPYQRIVMTRWRQDLRLYLDGNLQFSAVDEYRYHEALIHPAVSLSPRPESVLILGGGDGLAIREALKYPGVKRVTLVDIDPQMTRLGQNFPPLAALNQRALSDPRVKVVHQDAQTYLERGSELFDVIISDLPDPNTDVLAKLYSVQQYRLVKRRLARSGVFASQATSPFFSRDAFWCIVKTMREAGLSAAPYHAYVPSFGDWGFVLGGHQAIGLERARVAVPTRFLTPEVVRELFVFSKDASEVPVDVSTLDRPAILNYYLGDTRQWDQ